MAINNKIEVYQKNTRTIGCVVIGVPDISGYIPYLTVKKKTSDDISLLSKIGTISDPSGTILFTLTQIDTSLVAGDYVYDITVDNSSNFYKTVVKDRFSVLESVKH